MQIRAKKTEFHQIFLINGVLMESFFLIKFLIEKPLQGSRHMSKK